jgi:glycosyltransferase involved in cell wall biosynthesis
VCECAIGNENDPIFFFGRIFTFISLKDDLAKFMKRASLFLLPSKSFPFPFNLSTQTVKLVIACVRIKKE